MDYGSVIYVRWSDVHDNLHEEMRSILALPSSATAALDKARFNEYGTIVFPRLKPETMKIDETIIFNPSVIKKANEALAKVSAILKPSSLSVVESIPVAEEDIPILETPELKEPVLTLEGLQLVPVVKDDDLSTAPCVTCGHALDPFHNGVGNCEFAAGTVAACKCLGS